MFCFHLCWVFKRCCFKFIRLRFRFQNLPFSKSAGKKCAVFVWTGGLSVEFFIVFKMCRHRVNTVLEKDMSSGISTYKNGNGKRMNFSYLLRKLEVLTSKSWYCEGIDAALGIFFLKWKFKTNKNVSVSYYQIIGMWSQNSSYYVHEI